MTDLRNRRVITAALCGSWATKDMNPAVPYTPEEIARDAYECWQAGAAIVHIHVRNADGSPSTDFALYKEAVERIRAHKDCDVCINMTSSGSVGFGDEERIYPLPQLLPEMSSYDAGTGNHLFEPGALLLCASSCRGYHHRICYSGIFGSGKKSSEASHHLYQSRWIVYREGGGRDYAASALIRKERE